MIIWVMKIFFVQFCVFLLPLLKLFCFRYVHTISVLYWTHLCMKYSLGISNFLEEISSFPILLFSSISLHWSLRKASLSLLAILWNSALKWVYLSFSFLLCLLLLFFSQLFVRPPQTSICLFEFIFLGDRLFLGDLFLQGLQDLLELTPQKDVLFTIGD